MQMGLLHETISDALREVVQCVGGFKVVGARLWPEMSPDHAAGKLRDCLNTDRRERLSPEQVILILRFGREHGCHAAINYLATESGYATPQPVDPEDERAQLQREFIEAARELALKADRIERLASTPANLRRA